MNKAREQPIIIVKKKGHGHGHHGGAWKVAFADFMTAMFAMFLVLWLVNQSSDVKSAIAGYFQDPLGRADEFGSSIMPGEGAQTQSPRPMTAQQVIDLRRDRLRYVAEQIKQEIRETPALAEIADHVEVEITESFDYDLVGHITRVLKPAPARPDHPRLEAAPAGAAQLSRGSRGRGALRIVD